MRLLILLICTLFMLSKHSSAADEYLSRASRDWQIRGGVGMTSFRDFATSPLTYRGYSAGISLGRLKTDSLRHRSFSIHFYSGNTKPLSLYDLRTIEAHSSVLMLDYARLYRIRPGFLKRTALFAGAQLSANGIYRVNAGLMNNALGLDGGVSLMASFKLLRDVSRTESRRIKVLFIPIRLKERNRSLYWQFNGGMFNTNFRNGFAYGSLKQTTNQFPLPGDYRLNAFSGLRFSSDLAIRQWLSNGNAIQLNYHWDFYSSGRKFEPLEFAIHSLGFSFFFNTRRS
jgi:hypothetical protein